MSVDTRIFALGGLGEIGKNTYILEHSDEIYIIDAGIKFPGEELLGADYIIPDYEYLIKNQHKIQALIITHGHEDHIGGIPFMLKQFKIPTIYSGTFATELIKKKVKEHKIKNVNIKPIDDEVVIKSKHFAIEFFRVDHSIPDSFGVSLETQNGRVVTTGDFKFDLTPVDAGASYGKMAQISAKGVDLLLSDSTNSLTTKFSASERDIANNLDKIIREADGRVIVSTFASSLHRVKSIIEAGINSGRKLCVIGRSMENNVGVGQALGFFDIPKKMMIDARQMKGYTENDVLIICTGSQGETLAALSRMARGEHQQIKLKATDTVVFSSSPIPGNSVSVGKVINDVCRHGSKVLLNSDENTIHASGHASAHEQSLMLNLVKPTHFMPVHGEQRMLQKHAQTGIATGIPEENTFVVENGDVLKLRDKKVYFDEEKVSAGMAIVDGDTISTEYGKVLEDRRGLANNGIIIVQLIIDQKKKVLVRRPMILSRGFIYVKENQELMEQMSKKTFDTVVKYIKKGMDIDNPKIKGEIANAVGKVAKDETGRSPKVIPVVLNLKEKTK